MRLRIASDLHLPHHRDLGLSFAKVFAADSKPDDVLILAGDIVDHLTKNSAKMEETLKVLQGEHKDVIWVLGNHEFYYSDYHTTLNEAQRLADKLGWRLLENESCLTIEKIKICGTTGWFPYNDMNRVYEHWMNDFKVIRNSSYLYSLHQKAREFLLSTVDQDTVVVTHHLPSYGCVSEQYLGDNLNRFFVADLDDVLALNPMLWIYGHTHDKGDRIVSQTRTVANPLGYPGEKGPFSDLWIEMKKDA